MSTADPFGRRDTLDDSMLEALVVRFEARGKNPRFSQMLQEYLDAMHIDDAGVVLDMGCGAGLAARAIARRPGFSGSVTGVDLSPYLVEAAQRLVREEGLAQYTEFRAGDVRALQEAGLELVTSFPYVLSEVGEADFWSSAIEAYRRLMAKAQAMTQEEADAWAAALRSDSEAGVFFGSRNYYAYVARRP